MQHKQVMALACGVSLGIALFVVGCQTGEGARDTSTPEKALIGHWTSPAGENDYFGSDGTMTRVTDTGTIIQFTWSVASQNPKTRNMHFEIKNTGTPLGSTKDYTFSADFKSIVELWSSGLGEGTWTYVDAKQNP